MVASRPGYSNAHGGISASKLDDFGEERIRLNKSECAGLGVRSFVSGVAISEPTPNHPIPLQVVRSGVWGRARVTL